MEKKPIAPAPVTLYRTGHGGEKEALFTCRVENGEVKFTPANGFTPALMDELKRDGFIDRSTGQRFLPTDGIAFLWGLVRSFNGRTCAEHDDA